MGGSGPTGDSVRLKQSLRSRARLPQEGLPRAFPSAVSHKRKHNGASVRVSALSPPSRAVMVIVDPAKEGWTMQKKYVVRLTDTERDFLNRLIQKPRVSAQKLRRARVLLKADVDGPNWTDSKIAEAFDCRSKSVENIRQRLVIEGFEITLNGKPKRRVRGKVLDGQQQARIIALRLGQPPKGFANWTLRLLAERVVALEIVESVSHE